MNFGAGRRGHFTGTATLSRERSRKSNIHGVSSKLGQFLKTTTRLDMLGICCILLLQGLLADITRRNAVDQRWHLLSRQNGVTSHVLTCSLLGAIRPMSNDFGCFLAKYDFFGSIAVSSSIMATKTCFQKKNCI